MLDEQAAQQRGAGSGSGAGLGLALEPAQRGTETAEVAGVGVAER